MIKSAKKFREYFHDLYKANCTSIFINKSFDEIFDSNKTRIEYINKLFENREAHKLSCEGERVFEETIDYIVSFINGKEKGSNITVPEKYFKDMAVGAIIPTFEEMAFLLKVIKSNKIMYEMFYEDTFLYVKLPDESFNENMIRILEIKKHNIAHLLGLTEYEDITNNPSKNLLKKHFFSVVKESNKYYKGSSDAEKLLNWIVSNEGECELLRIHKKTLDFVKRDKIINPGSYIGNDLKPDSSIVSKFKERYKKSTGLDYPIINFSRLLVKSINTLNFLRLNNLVEVILDYNAPKGTSNEKDIFLVNRNSKKVLHGIDKFMNLRTNLLIDLYNYAHDSENIELRNKLISEGINVNSQNIKDQLNIIKAYDFIGAYGITPDDSIIDEKIIESINENFERNINLIGFGTDLENQKEIPLDKKVIHRAHCDTSIALTVPELAGHYYKYGRSFFLDKIESDRGVMMVSNINDEIHYLKRVLYIKTNATEELGHLIELKKVLNENYDQYLLYREMMIDKKRKK